MRVAFVLAVTALTAATVAVSLRPDRSTVTLGSLRQLWSDALRDADQPGMRLTRLSAAEEMRLGADLAAAIRWPDQPEPAERVTRVAGKLLPHIRRRGIEYHFRVVAAPVPNAFALPGGQIQVTAGMLDFVRSDDELAEIVGHEIAHVDLRHAVERYQYQYRLGSLGGLVEMTHRVATMPFSVDQELDADAEGLRLAVAGGYNPAAASTVFARLQEEFPEPGGPQANTPAGEVAESMGGVIFSFFRTHPPSAERARRLRELSARRR
jgi:Zn-dependent protease with chaperone function